MPVVEVVVDAGDAELAADALWQAGAGAVSELAAGAGRVRLIAEVADRERVEARWGARVIEPDQALDLDAWRDWAGPQRAGRRLLLQPAWLPLVDADPADIVVVLDPGRSFGSGSHASTRLVLAAMEDELRADDTVLDVGCGSGVLAVAACLLGAGPVTAIDVDGDAIRVTRQNAIANGVWSRIDASTSAVDEVPGRFDVVVANIGGRVLRSLAEPIRDRLAPGGLLVLAGLLDAQVDEVVAAYPSCREEDRRSLEGWGVALLRAIG